MRRGAIRVMAGLISGLAWGLPGAAHAEDAAGVHPPPVLAVLPGGPPQDPALRRSVIAALTESGYDQAILLAPEDLAGMLDLVSVKRAPGCRIPLDSWSLGVDAAAAALGADEWEEAWRVIRELDRDRACLTQPPGEAVLMRYHLTAATLSLYGAEEGQRWGDAAAEIHLAAALRPEAVPEGIDPEVLALLAAEREAQRAEGLVPLWVSGGLESSVHGQEPGALPGGYRLMWPPGPVWVWGGSPVAVQGTAEIGALPALLWVDQEGVDWSDVVAGVAALREGEPTERDQRLLGAVAALLASGGGAAPVYLSAGFGRVEVWRPEGDRLVQAERGARQGAGGGSALPAVDRWRAAYGVAMGGGFSNQESVGGAGGGPGLYARWRVSDQFSLAFSGMSLLTAAEGGYDGAAPLRMGMRFGPQTSRWVGEFGVDAGANWLGSFRPDSFSPLIGASGGASGRLGPQTAMRVELWAASGLEHGLFGLSLGVEGRLRARTELVETAGAGVQP